MILLKKNIKEMDKTWNNIYSSAVLKRCSFCLLPQTMPGILFDSKGVCNYCNSYKKVQRQDNIEWDKILLPYREKGKKPDCIVPFSGGRDSSFGLHYVKKVLGLHPIAFTHDSGLFSDIAKRNQKKMCDFLGIKQVVVYEDAKKTRRNILKNTSAWLKKPDLGMLPLLTLADKKPCYYSHKFKKIMGIKLLFACMGHSYEAPILKFGFCGIFNKAPMLVHEISLFKRVWLCLYYFKQCIVNPAYINGALLDSLQGYTDMFFMPIQQEGDILLFKYLKWDEQEITKTLIDNYGWECPSDTKLIWRADDVVSNFHNYIYLTVAGFTEHDTFRSAQVRDGSLSREEALKIIKEENKPQYKIIEWYAQQIGLDCNMAIEIINKIPKMYKV